MYKHCHYNSVKHYPQRGLSHDCSVRGGGGGERNGEGDKGRRLRKEGEEERGGEERREEERGEERGGEEEGRRGEKRRIRKKRRSENG